MKILAGVVTFNRCKLLGRCVDQIQRQTRPADEILVINNGSTDGTDAMLRDRNISFITQENVGSAGGWAAGIQFALDMGFDAVWLMDDDGYPKGDALAALEAVMSPDVACASSILVREDMPTHFVFPVTMLDKAGLPVVFGARRKLGRLEQLRKKAPDGTYPFVYLFNGALITTEAVRKIGNVNKDFFIFGEEIDYFFRLRQVGKVISVLKAVQFHPDVSRRMYTQAKIYYYIKNTMIINSRYMNAVALRNVLTVVAALGRTGKRNGLAKVLSYLLGRDAPVLHLAVVRGLQGKIGKDFMDWTTGRVTESQCGRSALPRFKNVRRD
jgi:rhamnopyranosyl-N-acetylglucosaminyl-diphospho-decaprenol beta-1,3/1,4-galactofuranosyltransferase